MDELSSTQFNLFSFPEEDVAPSAADQFGCCSRYRECSDAKACLIPELDYSRDCIYRKTLESGVVYYGRNAAKFYPSVYAEFLRRINALPKAARSVFDDLVIDFCEYHCGARRLIVRNKYIAQLSSVGLFDFPLMGSEFPRLCGYKSYLLPRLSDSPLFKQACKVRRNELAPIRKANTAAKKEAKAKGDTKEVARLDKELKQVLKKTPSEDSQEFICRWLNHEAVQIRDFMSQPYRFAERNLDLTVYLEEYYHNTLSSGCAARINSLSPFAVDGLLSAWDYEEEELRRIKVSRGYSAEEKARLIKPIEDARAERAEKKANKERNISDEEPVQKKNRTSHKDSMCENFLFGKTCVITGTLSRPREDVFFDILKCGGQISDRPVNYMDILILGRQEWSEQNGGIASRKAQKAAELCDKGKDILIISEEDLNKYIEDAKNSV